MKKILGLSLVMLLQLSNSSFAAVNDGDNVSDRGGRGGGHGGGGHGGGGHGGGGHGGGGHGGGGHGGWGGGHGGRHGGGRWGWDSSWQCVAKNGLGFRFTGSGYSRYEAERSALRSCNHNSLFSRCYVAQCY